MKNKFQTFVQRSLTFLVVATVAAGCGGNGGGGGSGSPYKGAAVDSFACLTQTKQEVMTKPLVLPPFLASKVGSLAVNASTARQDVEFSRDSRDADFSQVTGLEYTYEIVTKDHFIEVTYTFSPVAEGTNNTHFTLEEGIEVRRLDFLPIANFERTFNVMRDCSRVESDRIEAHLSWQSTQDGTIEWRQFELGSLSDQGSTAVNLNDFVIDQKMMAIGNEPTEAQILTLDRVEGPIAFLSARPNKGWVKFTTFPAVEQMNPMTGRSEKWFHFRFNAEVETLSMTIELRGTFDDSYIFRKFEAEGDTEYAETIGNVAFMTAALGEDTSEVKMFGFAKEDFSRDQLKFRIVKMNDRTSFPVSNNFAAYGGTSNGREVTVRKISVPFALPMSAPTSPGDEKFLRGNKYVQPELMRPHAVGLVRADMNRLELAAAIAKKVNELIVYDHDQVSNNVVRAMKTGDILANRKGICQHFANLFVALAREVGLPARVTAGFMLSADSAGGHAWVEVKLNDNDWWPLEPQYAPQSNAEIANFRLPDLGYYPASDMDFSEMNYQDDMTSFMELTKFFRAYSGARFEKIR